METLHRRIPPGYDGRGLGGSRKHRMSRYVFRLCRRTVPLPENRRKFEELYRVAHSAAEIYPFYDWQIWEIDSLIGMSRYKDGLDVYKRTTKLMFDELGLSPSAGMLERFKLMGERTSQAAGAIEDIKYRLREKESIEGAYYCTYPSFVDVYHVFGRMMERTGMSVFLMLCTLNFINIETDDENQKYYSELLRESIQKAVRKGDFYTRYNIQQYLVMLIGITQENCTLVSKRINKEFNKDSPAARTYQSTTTLLHSVRSATTKQTTLIINIEVKLFSPEIPSGFFCARKSPVPPKSQPPSQIIRNIVEKI